MRGQTAAQRDQGQKLKTSARIPTLIGCLIPLWIGVAGWSALANFSPSADPQLQEQFARKLSNEPELIVLGNSVTAAGVDGQILSRVLGRRVAVLTVPGSEAPAWYAALKNEVVAKGYKPRAVIVANSIGATISTTAESDQDIMHLDELMRGDEPVLFDKVLYGDAASPRWASLMRRRIQARRAALDGWHSVSSALIGQSSRSVSVSFNRVFSNRRIDYGLYNKPVPTKPATTPGTAAESLVPDLLDLADEIGAKFIFARMPAAPGTIDDGEPKLRELLSLLNERGGGFVDIDIEMRASEFQDPVHLKREGRQRFSTHLANQLLDIGVTSDAALPSARLPYPSPRITRKGQPPPTQRVEELAAADGSCLFEAEISRIPPITTGAIELVGLPPASPLLANYAGDHLSQGKNPRNLRKSCKPGHFTVQRTHLYVVPPSPEASAGPYEIDLRNQVTITDTRGSIVWVYPGTTLVLESTEPWQEDRGPMPIRVQAQSFGKGSGAATVKFGKRKPVPLKGFGGQIGAIVDRIGVPGDWRVEIRSPKNGPFVAIRSVSLGRGKNTVTVLSHGRSAESVTLNLIGRTPQKTAAIHLKRPPPVRAKPTLEWTDAGYGIFASPAFAAISDRKTGRCSPLVVLEDGEPMKRHKACSSMEVHPGQQCHAKGKIFFHPTGPNDQHKYDLAFDRTPNRSCNTELWVLPGDKLQVQLNPGELRRFYAGPTRLELTAEHYSLRRAAPQVRLRLWTTDEIIVDRLVDPRDLEKGLSIALPAALAPTTRKLTLEIDNNLSSAVLFQKATLVEDLGVTIGKDVG